MNTSEKSSSAPNRGEASGKTIAQIDLSSYNPEDYGCFQLVRRSGEQGEAWTDAFEQAALARIIDDSNKALFALRRGEIEFGVSKLDEVCQELKALEEKNPELPTCVVWRWIYGTEAFLHYLNDDIDAALEALAAAELAIKKSLELHDFLMPLAFQALDFIVQRARVARKERRWPDIQTQLDVGREMVTNERPLFVLDGGHEVFSHHVVDFYRAFDLTEQECDLLEFAFEPTEAVKRFESEASKIDMPTHFVVPYQ